MTVKHPSPTFLFPPILEEAIGHALHQQVRSSLLLISIDNLAMVISSHGGTFAENLLNEIGLQINKIIASSPAMFGKVSKNQFGVFLSPSTEKDMEHIALRIHHMIQNYGCTLSTVPIYIIASIGGVEFPRFAKTPLDVIDRAYIALNDAQATYSSFIAYGNTKKRQIESRNQLILANYIQTALLNHKLCLAFQPIICRKSGEIKWYECLLRIRDDYSGTITAGPFIPITERMGFIDLIDSFVMDKVITELRANKHIFLAFNLSSATLQKENWVKHAIQTLGKHPDIAARMIVEITETATLGNMKHMVNVVKSFQAVGCKVALDDFGGGNTSFSQLRHLPIDMVKIDGSYVKDIIYNKESRTLVKSMLDFTHSFGMLSIAEFVENSEIADMLSEMKVDYMQGNYFSPAINHRAWADD